MAPIYWRTKILLAKIESAYATDPTPSGAANAILATDIRLTPMDGADVSRELETPWLGAQGTIPAELIARVRAVMRRARPSTEDEILRFADGEVSVRLGCSVRISSGITLQGTKPPTIRAPTTGERRP